MGTAPTLALLPLLKEDKIVAAPASQDGPLVAFTLVYFVVVEAMAAGRPTIVAIDGVIREVVEKSKGGIFVPPGNDAALAEALDDADSLDYRLAWSSEFAQPRGRRTSISRPKLETMFQNDREQILSLQSGHHTMLVHGSGSPFQIAQSSASALQSAVTGQTLTPELTVNADGTVTLLNQLNLKASTLVVPTGTDGTLWSSNKTLYWVTATTTNKLGGP